GFDIRQIAVLGKRERFADGRGAIRVFVLDAISIRRRFRLVEDGVRVKTRFLAGKVDGEWRGDTGGGRISQLERLARVVLKLLQHPAFNGRTLICKNDAVQIGFDRGLHDSARGNRRASCGDSGILVWWKRGRFLGDLLRRGFGGGRLYRFRTGRRFEDVL